MNPYKVLGVPDGSPIDVCKKAYRALCRKHHPDSGGDKDMFDMINKAWVSISEGVQVQMSFDIKRSNLRHQTLFTFV